MNKKYGIGFFAAAILLVMLISAAFQLSYYKAKEQASGDNQTVKEETNSLQPSVAAEGQALKENCYYLMEVNGYIVVYHSDKKTPFEYTDIRYDELPPILREEIRNGKYVESTEDLYGFLENYSS